ncbi:MAG: alkaline phosphatase PhoX [Gammaproteobacteria bacterium]
MNTKLIALAMGAAVSVPGTALAGGDFGAKSERMLNDRAQKYFGFRSPLTESETVSVSRSPNQQAGNLILLAKGLKAEIVSRKAAHNSDMMAFWPNDNAPTHLVTCIEDDNDVIGSFPSGQIKYTPSVQTVDLATGEVKTILRGMSGCDGIRRTPWNTIVATEEEDDGGLYEILNPLAMTGLTLVARGSSTVVDTEGHPANGMVAYRGALGVLAWEGLDINAQGIVYYGDEERPGSGGADADGGSLFKFVPGALWDGTPISDLAQSPLAQGQVYAYQASCQARTSSSFPQFGQGCEIGEGAWVKIDPANARASAFANSATGFYRPEDGHFDPNYSGDGVRFCWANTGNTSAFNHGEVVCLIDTLPEGTGELTGTDSSKNSYGLTYLANHSEASGFAVAEVNRVLEGDHDLNQPDNLAFQPEKGNMYVIEDNPFGDIWACLPDGDDRDIKSDGCVKMLSVRDSSAEPTGFMFTADGKTAYLHIQHSDDSGCVAGSDCESIDGYPTDDLIRITGFKVKK